MITKKPLNILKTNKKVHDEYINMYNTPSILLKHMENLHNTESQKALVLKGGRGSGKSTVAIHYTINCMLYSYFQNRNFIFGGWKKEDTKETFNKIKLEIKRLRDDIKDGFVIDETKKQIIYKPNQTTIMFIPLTDFMDGKSKIENLNRLKAYNNACLWVIDEANFITEHQLDIMTRTGRENYNALKKDYKGEEELSISSNAKLLFMLNPSKPTGDFVVNYFKDRKDGKIVHINMDDLPIKYQSKELLKTRNEDARLLEDGRMSQETFNHIWFGEPQYDLHYQPFYNINQLSYKLFEDKIPNNIFKAVLDISAGGGDNSVLMFGIKVVEDYYIYGVASNLATVDPIFINLIKSKGNIFKHKEILYEKNGVGGNIFPIFNQNGIKTISYSQRKNKDLKISSIFGKVKNIHFIKDGSKESELCLKNIIGYNPSTSKTDDEVDVLSELINFLDRK